MASIKKMSYADFLTHTDRVIELITSLRSRGKQVDAVLVKNTFASAHAIVLGAFEHNELVGVLVGNIKNHLTGKEMYIDDVVVLEKYREKGIGTQLLRYIERVAVKNHCTALTMTSSRVEVYKKYERNGYAVRDTAVFHKAL